MIFAVAPNPMGPPILNNFSNILDIDRIISGNIFQNQSNAERLDITMIKGKIWNANIIAFPCPDFSNGDNEPLLR